MYDSQQINNLRKTGQLDAALALTRETLARDPNELWNKRAAVWVFYECCKNALRAKDYQAARKFLADFDALTLPEEDEVAHTNMNRLRARIAMDTTKRPKDPQSLVQHYHQLIQQSPGNALGIGWNLYRDLKELINNDQVSNGTALALLRVYAKLDIEKPSQLHSMFLNLALKLIDNPAKLLDFVKWWGLSNLREEDFARNIYKGHSYNSPAETLATNLAKSIEKTGRLAEVPLVIPLLERLIKKYPDNIWLQQHKGKLLILTDQVDQAKTCIVPVVRAKMSESWAWELLADLYPDDPHTELACLCRALQTKQEEQFLVSIRLRLAALLTQLRDYSAAKYEVEKVRTIYETNNWKFRRELTDLLNESWYDAIESTADNNNLYRTHAARVQDLILADLPLVNGVVSRQQPERDGKPGRALISYKQGNKISDIPVKYKQFKWLKKAELGTPVTFHLVTETGRARLLDLKRRQGEPWDLFESFNGPFKAVKHFGFVTDRTSGHEIFIPPHLVTTHHPNDGQMVTGRARYGIDPKKKRPGWRAVTLTV